MGTYSCTKIYDQNDPIINIEYSLSQPITDFQWIKIIWRTNVGYDSQDFPVDTIVNKMVGSNDHYCCKSHVEWANGANYISLMKLWFVSTSKIKYNGSYQNQNIYFKPVQIYGIKY